jgi:cell division septal protein FtsQ
MQLALNGVERRQVVALLALVGGVILFVYFTYFSYSSKQVAQFKVF